MQSNVVPYEGFTKNETEDIDGSANILDGSDNILDGSSNILDGSDNILDGSANILDGSENKEEGFTTLRYANVDNISQIESISTVKGSMNCLLQSSNLTNSMGPLCLTPEQQTALQTRGGNASCPHM
tara:strand:- start:119 stop:499 length:381 start_codon:yes stop_codon:yes gene_type:complete